MSAKQRREAFEGFLFLLPNFLGFLIFFAIPLALSFYYSFTDYNLFQPPNFIGLQNYITALGFNIDPEAYRMALAEGSSIFAALGELITPKDPTFWIAIGNTFKYAIGVLILCIMPSFFLAWLLNSRLPGMAIYRGMFYIPVVASIVGSALVWFWIYNRDSGVLNTALAYIANSLTNVTQSLGFKVPEPIIGWLVDSNYSLLSLVILTSWATIGYDMVIFLAALQGIPRHLYEAATVDGATRWQSLFKITIPMISATIFFILVTNTIAVLQIFSEPYIMTQGGPANSTLTIVYYLYQKGFQRFQMGYGSALAWLVFAIIFIITTLQFRVANRWVYEE
jgi:multiple sugar transport system permease protein